MDMKKRFMAVALAGLTAVAAHVAAQGTPPQAPPAGGQPAAPQPPPPAGRGGGGRGQGGGRGVATFPAQQRPPGDPVLIETRQGALRGHLQRVPRADLRGGGTGGPNLLRSQVVLNDQHGELILPIVHGARAEQAACRRCRCPTRT